MNFNKICSTQFSCLSSRNDKKRRVAARKNFNLQNVRKVISKCNKMGWKKSISEFTTSALKLKTIKTLLVAVGNCYIISIEQANRTEKGWKTFPLNVIFQINWKLFNKKKLRWGKRGKVDAASREISIIIIIIFLTQLSIVWVLCDSSWNKRKISRHENFSSRSHLLLIRLFYVEHFPFPSAGE